MDRTDNGEYLDRQWDSESDEDEDEEGPAALKISPERIPRLLNRGLKKSLTDIMVLLSLFLDSSHGPLMSSLLSFSFSFSFSFSSSCILFYFIFFFLLSSCSLKTCHIFPSYLLSWKPSLFKARTRRSHFVFTSLSNF